MITGSGAIAQEPTCGAVVWIDRHRAVIVEQRSRGRDSVEIIDRRPNEPAVTFEARAADRILDRGHIMVAGPADARTEFERVYVAVTHRPDHIHDVELDGLTARRLGRTA
jgi:hypothetical protein